MYPYPKSGSRKPKTGVNNIHGALVEKLCDVRGAMEARIKSL